MSQSLSFIFLLSVACGLPREDVVSTCNVPGFGKVTFEFKANCDAVAANFEAVRVAFDVHGVLSAKDFNYQLGGVPIHVRKYLAWGQQDGVYMPVTGIELGNRMQTLAHELMHALDAARFGVLSGAHIDWDKNGRNEAASDYMSSFQPPFEQGDDSGAVWGWMPGTEP
jgi:hypothetical protein